ncbi:MAG: DNA helicase II / ATP-dependent DNA helicase PcrA [Anaerolineaceae bacterium]|nr:MAG: DNA helicase II / ATP-dependent DNA helicase PcrA [Anaerolineaceae bacterium]
MTDFTPRPAQSQILAYTGGKMGISAVPGSGKTHTLSALAAQVIRSGALADEQEVLIVTLVNSAVDNFSARIKEFLALPMPFGYRVRTLHGLAHDIVREKPSAAGLEDRFSIIDEREADFIRKEAANAWLQSHASNLNDYLLTDMDEGKRDWVRRQQLPDLVTNIAMAFIRSAKDNRLTPDKIRNLLDRSPAPLPLAAMGLEIYTDYQRALTYRGAVDFDDLIRLALDLLEHDTEFLERLRYRWPYILEDEAQDSSKLQEDILRLLAGPGGNWVRVGDPNQAIFETFTTASPQHLIDFVHEEGVQYRELPDSGRCQPSIISLANQLIEWVNREHPESEARDALTVPYIQATAPDDPQPNPPDNPDGVRLIGKKYAPEEEVEAVAKSVAKWLPEHQDSTVAILVPRNQRGVEVIEALKKRGIPFVELLGSTSSTRLASGRLGDVLACLADPQSAAKLSKAYLAWRRGGEEEAADGELHRQASGLLRKCAEVETFTAPHPGHEWLADIGSGDVPAEIVAELEEFQRIVRRWQGTTLLPIDQMILTLAQDLFTAPHDLALAHKLALVLRQAADDHSEWRLPELTGELGVIARNERRFLGFSEDDSGFDPSRHAGKVVVTTMHKAKGLEWDRVYLMSANNYDFPSAQPNDRYISERWFIRDGLNLEAETLAQLEALGTSSEFEWYAEGQATGQARLGYVRERLRLLYVGITRAKKELVITWNTGRTGEQTPAIPLVALQGWWEENKK